MVEVRFHKLEGEGGVFPRIRFSMEVIIPSSEQQYKGYLINAKIRRQKQRLGRENIKNAH